MELLIYLQNNFDVGTTTKNEFNYDFSCCGDCGLYLNDELIDVGPEAKSTMTNRLKKGDNFFELRYKCYGSTEEKEIIYTVKYMPTS
ncbi:MAG: hypothetical protein N3D84_01215 [Candidatus Woesearchaeota archaeon]|nr:hypothetical protein [Candidatus Woesearchaeota archaeon]